MDASGDRVTWSYDNTYQLTREQRSGANSYHLTYSYSYEAADQIQTEKMPSGTTMYNFDNNGNQSRKVEPGRGRTTWPSGVRIRQSNSGIYQH